MREKPGLKVGPFQFSFKQFSMSFVAKLLDLTKFHLKILMWSRERCVQVFQVAEEKKNRES